MKDKSLKRVGNLLKLAMPERFESFCPKESSVCNRSSEHKEGGLHTAYKSACTHGLQVLQRQSYFKFIQHISFRVILIFDEFHTELGFNLWFSVDVAASQTPVLIVR